MYYFSAILVVYSLLTIVYSAPISDEDDVELHDQRQNGTENYRLEMKDVLIVFSPLDTIFSVAGLASEAGLFKQPQANNDGGLTLFADLKNYDEPEIEEPVYHHQRPMKKWSNSRLANVIRLFVDRRRLGNLSGTY